MKFTKKQILGLALILSFCLIQVIAVLSVPAVNANGLWEMQEGFTGDNPVGNTFGQSTGDPTDIRDIAIIIIKIFFTFIGIILIIMLIMGGFKWMTAAGNEDKVKEAKSQIKTAMIGLIIILSSYLITTFIEASFRKEIGGSIW